MRRKALTFAEPEFSVFAENRDRVLREKNFESLREGFMALDPSPQPKAEAEEGQASSSSRSAAGPAPGQRPALDQENQPAAKVALYES